MIRVVASKHHNATGMAAWFVACAFLAALASARFAFIGEKHDFEMLDDSRQLRPDPRYKLLLTKWNLPDE